MEMGLRYILLTRMYEYVRRHSFIVYIIVSVIFSGIDLNNTREYFEGRAKFGADFVNDGMTGDPNGHGTHVAGIAASKQYGMAPKAEVIAVRVLSSTGSGSFA